MCSGDGQRVAAPRSARGVHTRVFSTASGNVPAPHMLLCQIVASYANVCSGGTTRTIIQLRLSSPS